MTAPSIVRRQLSDWQHIHYDTYCPHTGVQTNNSYTTILIVHIPGPKLIFLMSYGAHKGQIKNGGPYSCYFCGPLISHLRAHPRTSCATWTNNFHSLACSNASNTAALRLTTLRLLWSAYGVEISMGYNSKMGN